MEVRTQGHQMCPFWWTLAQPHSLHPQLTPNMDSAPRLCPSSEYKQLPKVLHHHLPSSQNGISSAIDRGMSSLERQPHIYSQNCRVILCPFLAASSSWRCPASVNSLSWGCWVWNDTLIQAGPPTTDQVPSSDQKWIGLQNCLLMLLWEQPLTCGHSDRNGPILSKGTSHPPTHKSTWSAEAKALLCLSRSLWPSPSLRPPAAPQSICLLLMWS